MPSKAEKNLGLQTITQRPRRLRGSVALRDMIAETHVKASDLIAPFFVIPGSDNQEPIGALPGISRFSVDLFLRELERALKLGVRSAILFGVLPVGQKDANASSANDPHGPVASAIRAARGAFGNDVTLISDVCLCAHTDHGHCGILRDTPRGLIVDNDSSQIGRAHV